MLYCRVPAHNLPVLLLTSKTSALQFQWIFPTHRSELGELLLAFLCVFCSILVNSQLYLTTSIPLKHKTTHSFVRLRGVENFRRQMLIYNQSLHPTPEFRGFCPPPLSHYINVCQNKHTGISCNEECNKLPKKTKKLRSLFELHFRTCGKLAEMLSQASNGWPCILYTKSFVYQNVPFDVH